MIQSFEIINEFGNGPLVLVCEHASNFIPKEYGSLGLDVDLLESHIAWDPGALAVATQLSTLLDSPLLAAKVSRLVYDCNRPPEAKDAIVTHSEVHDIPGNTNLSDEQRQNRVDGIYKPFSKALSDLIAQRIKRDGQSFAVVTIHSFTPVFKGEIRAVELGILHDSDSRLADYILAPGQNGLTYNVLRNEPYSATDGVTHTLRTHAVTNGLPNVMIEIRNDLIADASGVEKMANDLAHVIAAAVADCLAKKEDQPQ